MSTDQSPMVGELAKLFEAAWVDLPLAAAKRLLGNEDDHDLRQAGWKAYDAFIRLNNEAANRLYANRAFGIFVGRSMEASLRVQRVVDAAASALFGNLWPAIGLPTAGEVRALRDDLKSLLEELRADRIEAQEEGEPVDQHFDGVRSTEVHKGAAAVIFNDYRPVTRRKAKKGRGNVAL